MRVTVIVPLGVLCTLMLTAAKPASERPSLHGPYLGQKPPDTRPEIFAPGLVSTEEHFEFVLTVSASGREIYFTRRMDGTDVIMVTRQSEEGWSKAEPAEALNGVGGFEQHASPSRDRVYFSRLAPPPGSKINGPPKTREEEAMMVGIWYIDRTDSGWSEPVYCTHGMYVTTTSDGTIYTTDIRGPSGVSRSAPTNGKYSELEMLGGGINDPAPGAHPCVAHDESFVVFDSKRDGGQGGESDLYVCFRNGDGSWGDAVNLGDEVNTDGPDFCPSLSPDGKYLFFSSRGDIYWVSTEAIGRLRE
jgi:hypothetical protein